MKKVNFFLLLLCFGFCVQAQTTPRPKLVVGLVVDQMRWDYLYRYSNRYGKDGFKRLLREGFSCENTFIPYTPTYTAPGHTCIYTGSVPSLHGIIGNNWYNRATGKVVYCTDDSSVQAVGSSSIWGKMSPRNLWANTITDELRLSNNFKSKTISLAIKDRSSILPGGHTSNGSYWFDATNGSFITSTYYMNALPAWVTAFNAKHLPDTYLKNGWTTLYPANTYSQSTADAKVYEKAIPGEDNTFFHNTDSISNGKYESFKYTPYGNTFTFDIAKAAIANEGLGKRDVTDFLAVSFSSTDYIGHNFGPNSLEIEDTYLRFDKDLADFLKYLDATVGKGNYLLFLSADHGVAHVPGFEKENKLPAGNLDDVNLQKTINTQLQKQFNTTASVVSSVINYQVYLNYDVVAKEKLDRKALKESIINILLQNPGIEKAFDVDALQTSPIPEKVKMMLVNGYNQRLSGDVEFIFKPQFFDWGGTSGTTHGTWSPYDAHIPLVWFGWNIKPGSTNREVYMTDIAATLAALLHIQMPNACIGKVIEEVTK